LLHNILDAENRGIPMDLNEDIDIIDPDQNENARQIRKSVSRTMYV